MQGCTVVWSRGGRLEGLFFLSIARGVLEVNSCWYLHGRFVCPPFHVEDLVRGERVVRVDE